MSTEGVRYSVDVIAVSEGFCPTHHQALRPVETPRGPGGLCPSGEAWCIHDATEDELWMGERILTVWAEFALQPPVVAQIPTS